MTNTWSGFDGSVDETEDARRSQFQGSAVPVVASSAANLVTANTSSTRTVNIAGGVSWAHGVRASFDDSSAVFDVVPTTGQSRWDAVVMRRNWDANTCAFAVVKGVAAESAPMVLPSALNDNIGVLHDQVLALVQITYNVATPTAVVDWRARAYKIINVANVAALPAASTSLYGMEASISDGTRYRCTTDSANNPAWVVSSGTSLEATQTGVIVTASGWNGGSLANRALYNPTSGEVNLDIQVRNTGTGVFPTSSGNFADTEVLTVAEAFRPQRLMPFFGQYAAIASSAGPSSTAFVWLPCFGNLGIDGKLILQSGVGGYDLRARTGSSDISLRTHLRFTRKV